MAKGDLDARGQPAEKRLSGLQLGLVALFALLFVGSLVLRGRSSSPGGAAGLPAGASGLTATDPEATPEEAPPLERALPYVTESSLFGLIGCALGYASRKFLKLALIGLALFFVGLQTLVWLDAVTIDWSALVARVNAGLLELRDGEPLTSFLTRRVPAAGGLLLGYWVGFARG